MQVINPESDARIVSFAVCLKKLQYLTERLKVVNDFGVNNVACVSSPRRSALVRGGRKGGTNTAIPHMVAREYRNTASKFSQIPKPQLQMGKS